MEQFITELTAGLLKPALFLGFLAGGIGSLRAFVATRDRHAVGIGLLNILIGACIGAVAADVFAQPEQPLSLAIAIGLPFGAAGSYILDALAALLPRFVVNGLKGILPPWAAKALEGLTQDNK